MPNDYKRRKETIDEAVSRAQTGVGNFENPISRLTRLHKEGKTERAKNLAVQIREAAPGLSSKPLSARDKLRLRKIKDKRK